jgi:hypothetical protein
MNGPGLIPGSGKLFSPPLVHTRSGCHLAPSPVGTEGSFLGVELQMSGADHLLLPSAEKKLVELYLHSPIRLHGKVLN